MEAWKENVEKRRGTARMRRGWGGEKNKEGGAFTRWYRWFVE